MSMLVIIEPKNIQDAPSISPSSYNGLNADIRAERCVAIAAWVCWFVNVGSNISNFCSTAWSWFKSSSSSDDAAAVFCN